MTPFRRSPTGAAGRLEELLDRVAAGGRRFERIVLTRNRRVMVSVSDRGRVLRLHELFGEAPTEVLREVGVFCAEPRTARGRRARQRIREYLHIAEGGKAAVSSPPLRRPAYPRPEDAPLLARLRNEFDAVNVRYFDAALPLVPMRISDRMRGRNGHFRADPPEIAISRLLFTSAAEGEAEHTLRHEMIHLWQWAAGGKPGHGADFRRWARILDVHPRARRYVRQREPQPHPGAGSAG